jgi:hypothetical protein
MDIQLTFDDEWRSLWSPPKDLVLAAAAAVKRIAAEGEARHYSEAHLAARYYLGFLEPEPVGCAHCPATEATVKGIWAALDWQNVPAERLRIDYKGRVFGATPDLDYIPLCRKCHRRYDSWLHALPPGIRVVPELPES